MNKLRVLIADDELPARNKMKRMLESLEMSDTIFMAENGIDALSIIQTNKPDIAFLDIEMPGKTGLEVAREMDSDETLVIFATAYNEHAIKAFELNAMDYLLKPFNEERLKSSIERAMRNGFRKNIEAEHLESVKETDEFDGENPLPFANKIPVPTRDRYKLIDYDDIVCIEVEERSVRLYTIEKSYLLNHPLETFEKRLPMDKFFRVSRSTIISFSHVKEIVIWFGNRFKIILNNDKEVISSREKSKVLKHVLKI
jgi:two-component system LytT family response regulator/two-component system response regulator LytT